MRVFFLGDDQPLCELGLSSLHLREPTASERVRHLRGSQADAIRQRRSNCLSDSHGCPSGSTTTESQYIAVVLPTLHAGEYWLCSYMQCV